MKNTNYKNWHRQHAKVWEIMPSPARPSLGEVAIFQKYLDSLRIGKEGKIKVLILGSTPEFRDLCNGERYEVICIDVNQPIYEALTLLQKKPNLKERYICDNWLTFKDKKKYNIILGDAVTAMFPLGLYTQFFENMSQHLVKGGLLAIRVPYQDNRFKVPIKKVMQNYRNIYKSKNVHIYTATYNFLVMNYLNKEKSSVTLSSLGQKIEDLYEYKILTKKECDELRLYYKSLTLELSYPKEDFLRSTATKSLEYLAKEFSLDYLTSLSNPVFVFTKRD
jgi:SAM-dependent methyltransferase